MYCICCGCGVERPAKRRPARFAFAGMAILPWKPSYNVEGPYPGVPGTLPAGVAGTYPPGVPGVLPTGVAGIAPPDGVPGARLAGVGGAHDPAVTGVPGDHDAAIRRKSNQRIASVN